MFYVAVLVRVVKVLFLVQLRGGVALHVDAYTLVVEAVHVNAVTTDEILYYSWVIFTPTITVCTVQK